MKSGDLSNALTNCKFCGHAHKDLLVQDLSQDDFEYTPWGVMDLYVVCPVTNLKVTFNSIPTIVEWKLVE